MIVCDTRDNSLHERLLQECNLTLSKAISAGHVAEESYKHAHKILRSQPTANIDKIFKKKLNKSTHNTCNQNTRDFIKKCKFCGSSHTRGKCPDYRKNCHVCNKKNYFKVCYPRVSRKVHETEKDQSDEPSDQSDYEFSIETVINIQDSTHITQIKNENSDWSITLPSNGIPVSYKINTGAQCYVIPLTVLKKFDPKPDLCPVNIKL